MRKKRIIIIAVWIVFLLVAGSILGLTELRSHTMRALQELQDQSDVVVKQLPNIIKNDGYAQLDVMEMREARLESLHVALEGEMSFSKAQQIGKDFFEVADVRGLAFYNQDGMLLSTIGSYDADEWITEPEYIVEYADTLSEVSSRELYEDMILNQYELYQGYILSDRALEGEGEEDFYFDARKCGQWYVGIEFNITEDEKKAMEYFGWKSTLGRIKMRNNGYILVVDKETGTILSHKDQTLIGKPLDTLHLQIRGTEKQTTIEELNEAFSDFETPIPVSIYGDNYYALRMNVEDTMMLALLPEKEIRDETIGSVMTWMFILALVSGICMLYVLFYMEEENEYSESRSGKVLRNRGLSGRIRVSAMLAAIVILCISLFMDLISRNAEVIRYNQQKAYDVLVVLIYEEYYNQKLADMYQRDEVIRARVADVVLRSKKENEITPAFLEKLANSLDVRSCSYYDTNGKLQYSNSAYADNLEKDSAMFGLFKGRDQVVEEVVNEEDTPVQILRAGVPVFDKAGRCLGAVVVEKESNSLGLMLGNLSYDSILREVNFSDATYLLILKGEDQTVKYYGLMNGGNSERYNESGDMKASDLLSDTEKLRDAYNGNLSMNGYTYYAGVRTWEDYVVVIMRDMKYSKTNSVIAIVLEVLLCAGFMMLLVPITCYKKKQEALLPEEEEEEQEAVQVSNVEAAVEEGKKRENVLNVLSTMTNKNKPYFEERWAKDSTRWRDRTPSQKFNTAFVLVCFLAVVSILLQAIFMGENSVWTYTLAGDWEKGLSVHSFVLCVLVFCSLFFAKVVIHKILYLIARAASARGETICHLLDSFLVFVLYILGILMCLVTFGFDLKTLTVTSGVTYLIISFSCQNILADMMAGILMILENVVRVGDYILYNDKPYIVYSIGIRTTRLKWYSEVLSIRNNEFKDYISFVSGTLDLTVVNVGLDYQESIERFESIVEKELPYLHNRLNELAGEEVGGPIYRGIEELADNCILVSFAFFCNGESKFRIRRLLNNEILYMCERNDILLALPQVVVHEPEEKRVFDKEEFAKETDED